MRSPFSPFPRSSPSLSLTRLRHTWTMSYPLVLQIRYTHTGLPRPPNQSPQKTLRFPLKRQPSPNAQQTLGACGGPNVRHPFLANSTATGEQQGPPCPRADSRRRRRHVPHFTLSTAPQTKGKQTHQRVIDDRSTLPHRRLRASGDPSASNPNWERPASSHTAAPHR